ncbi:MAG: GYD domain-containing protein [Dehalococcoidia bacterium]|nr:GYD domain-containing protein [Dehalococcoidia bacterium]
MIFISLIKFKHLPSKEDLAKVDKLREELNKKGIKSLAWYWTLGRFDGVLIYEAPTEKDAMKFAVESAKLGLSSTETLVAIPREEAIKLL